MAERHLDLANYLPYLLNRVGFAMVESFSADALKGTGLSIDMWRVLAVLAYVQAHHRPGEGIFQRHTDGR